MRLRILILSLAAILAASSLRAAPALTIYNQNFAVVRDAVPLDLKAGVNDISFADTTAHLEPDSVILRDPAGKTSFRILEQNYRNDPVSQELLLSLFEGKTIDFLIRETGKPDITAQGKIIRSGYVPHSRQAAQRYGEDYAADQPDANQPVIEHLYRWTNWEITGKSDTFTKENAQEIKFLIKLKPDEEKTVAYTVHYTW